jgi:hypothetical protein
MTGRRTRADALAKLAETRRELLRLFEPPHESDRANANGADAAADGGEADEHEPAEFPRSRTMRLLTSNRGLGAVALVGGSLLLSRPALLGRVLRLLPVGALARTAVLRLVARKAMRD